METPKNPGELKSMWEKYSIGEIALFFSLAFIFLSAVNAAGILIAQKMNK